MARIRSPALLRAGLAVGAAPLALGLAQPAGEPTETVLRRDSGTHVIAETSRDIVAEKTGRVDHLVVRHVIFAKVEVADVARASAPPEGEPAEPAARICRWTMTTYLQRDICFASVVGLTGCTQPVVRELPHAEGGQFELPPQEEDGLPCDRTSPAATTALERLSARVGREGTKIVDADVASDVRPAMLKAGAKLR